jgi:hypothetical protein
MVGIIGLADGTGRGTPGRGIDGGTGNGLFGARPDAGCENGASVRSAGGSLGGRFASVAAGAPDVAAPLAAGAADVEAADGADAATVGNGGGKGATAPGSGGGFLRGAPGSGGALVPGSGGGSAWGNGGGVARSSLVRTASLCSSAAAASFSLVASTGCRAYARARTRCEPSSVRILAEKDRCFAARLGS